MSISILPENIKYRAEGNAGIVVYLIEEGTVLRLKKQDNACKNVSSAREVLKELESEIKVTNDVWKLILGESFINTPLLVFLEAEKIKILNEAISQFRPIHRIHKSVNEVDTYVFMFPDFCSLPQSLKCMPVCGPVLSIEIKPKQGFVKEEYVISAFQPLSIPICSYCMMQRYKFSRENLAIEKLKIGKISSKSRYCPSDLFSGCHHRMFHALNMLFETPQNNLRLFKNQNLIYSEEKRGILNELLADFISSEKNRTLELLCDIILQILVKPFPYGLQKTPVSFQKKFHQNCINGSTFCGHEFRCELPRYCILERILSCQMLDDLKISELYQLYIQVKGNVDKQNSIGCYSRSEIPTYIGKLGRNVGESEYEYASRKVWEFLAALTMKDCSIMITMQRLSPNCSVEEYSQNIISDKYGNSYVFSIALADLDSKSLNKVEKVYNDFISMLKLIDIEHEFK